MTNHLHRSDLPAHVTFKDSIAVDTETMGLRLGRDRLCLVQLSAGDGDAHLVQGDRQADAPDADLGENAEYRGGGSEGSAC